MFFRPRTDLRPRKPSPLVPLPPREGEIYSRFEPLKPPPEAGGGWGRASLAEVRCEAGARTTRNLDQPTALTMHASGNPAHAAARHEFVAEIDGHAAAILAHARADLAHVTAHLAHVCPIPAHVRVIDGHAPRAAVVCAQSTSTLR